MVGGIDIDRIEGVASGKTAVVSGYRPNAVEVDWLLRAEDGAGLQIVANAAATTAAVSPEAEAGFADQQRVCQAIRNVLDRVHIVGAQRAVQPPLAHPGILGGIVEWLRSHDA